VLPDFRVRLVPAGNNKMIHAEGFHSAT